jgi:hypothetical protein
LNWTFVAFTGKMQSEDQDHEAGPGQLVVAEEETDAVTASSSAGSVPSSTEQGFEVADARRRQLTAQERKVEEKKALEKKLKG